MCWVERFLVCNTLLTLFLSSFICSIYLGSNIFCVTMLSPLSPVFDLVVYCKWYLVRSGLSHVSVSARPYPFTLFTFLYATPKCY